MMMTDGVYHKDCCYEWNQGIGAAVVGARAPRHVLGLIAAVSLVLVCWLDDLDEQFLPNQKSKKLPQFGLYLVFRLPPINTRYSSPLLSLALAFLFQSFFTFHFNLKTFESLPPTPPTPHQHLFDNAKSARSLGSKNNDSSEHYAFSEHDQSNAAWFQSNDAPR